LDNFVYLPSGGTNGIKPGAMKQTVLWMALMFSVGVFAQKPEPHFEQDGAMLKATYFHENGEVAQQGYFLNGNLHGNWVMFDQQGNKMASGTYLQGEKSGKWFFWKAELLHEVDYAANRIVQVREWSRNGLVTAQQ